MTETKKGNQVEQEAAEDTEKRDENISSSAISVASCSLSFFSAFFGYTCHLQMQVSLFFSCFPAFLSQSLFFFFLPVLVTPP